MKLFVFEEVLIDYSAGMIVVIAKDLEAALVLAQKDVGYDFPFSISNVTIFDSLDEEFCAHVSGG